MENGVTTPKKSLNACFIVDIGYLCQLYRWGRDQYLWGPNNISIFHFLNNKWVPDQKRKTDVALTMSISLWSVVKKKSLQFSLQKMRSMQVWEVCILFWTWLFSDVKVEAPFTLLFIWNQCPSAVVESEIATPLLPVQIVDLNSKSPSLAAAYSWSSLKDSSEHIAVLNASLNV